MSRPEVAGMDSEHTVLAVYLVGLCAAFTITYDSTQEIAARYHINKKWFYLYGATCFFAYLYVRPLIRKRLGSASRGYINWGSVYIAWLLSAISYHLPTLESMGVDLKADISLLLTVFLLSLATLGVLHGMYGFAVLLKLADPWLLSRAPRRAWAPVVLNSMTVALACSTYYSFCGNAAAGAGRGAVKELVCGRWLPPVTTKQHPAFKSWVLYGEPAGGAGAPPAGGGSDSSGGDNATCLADSGTCPAVGPLLGNASGGGGSGGSSSGVVGQAISPVFTLWLTLVMMFGVNCLADYSAASAIRAAYEAQMRSAEWRHLRSYGRHSLRRRSSEFSYEYVRQANSMEPRSSMEALFKSVSGILPANIWSPTTGALKAAQDRLMSWRDDGSNSLVVGLAALAREHRLSGAGPAPVRKLVIPPDSPQPHFLPMFPWYSGTSADLLKTLFDLLISVKLFLGRFDMRTMQVATGSLGNGPDPTPQDGDGFTYEHLADREELWFDFCADTGDGGDPTYAVARCMAAPQLQVTVPAHLLGGSQQPEGAGKRAAGVVRTLPRAQLLVHGGDLAYPNPTDETYVQRLFKPYEAALPPPSHVHPGHLVVNKPDLPPQYWVPPGACKCGLPPQLVGGLPGAEQQRQCKLCQKAEALRAYEGPSCFMVPGNHDWIDGLETFQRHIQHKGWIGGWLLPQEKSYFALRLPHGWWLFGIDLALVDDIDMMQFRYFARIAEERMGPEDQAIIALHCPTWLVDWFWGTTKGANLRQLIRGPLRGRARMTIAGDLHFYMRHSFQPYTAGATPSLCPSLAPSALCTPAGSSPVGQSPASSRAPTPTPSLRGYALSPSQLHQSLMARLTGGGGSGSFSRVAPAPAAAGQQPQAPGVGGQAAPAAAPQQQQQGQVGPVAAGRAVDMECGPVGGSPAGGSPLGGSPTVPSLLLDAVHAEQSAAAQQAQQGKLARQRSGSRWSAAASMAAAAMGRRWSGAASGEAAAAAGPTAGAGAGSDAADPGSLPCSPTASELQQQGLWPGKPSAPMAAGRSKTTLPILSPVHGSQLELSAAGGAEAEAVGDEQPALPAVPEDAARATAANGLAPSGSASAPSLQEAATAAAAAAAAAAAPPPPLASDTSSGTHPLQRQDSAAAPLERSPSASTGSSPPRPAVSLPPPPAGQAAGGATSSSSPFGGWWPGLRSRGSAGSMGEAARKLERNTSGGAAAGVAGEEEEGGEGEGWHLNDPEHLVVSGTGGGFLHPTHVFSYSRFRPAHDPAAGPVFLQERREEDPRGKGSIGAGGQRRPSRTASSTSLYSLSHQEAEAQRQQELRPAGGEYRCAQSFPTPEQSLRLGRRNLHMFRMTNNRFDIIGGMLYYLLVVSVLPRCSGVADILEASTVLEAVRLFAAAGWDIVVAIVLESYISVAVLAILWLMCLGFARSGGIGAMDGVVPSLRRRPEFHGSSMAVRARIGGAATQLLYATAHALAHLTAAVSLLLLLELGVATVMKYEGVGREGYHSLYKWYRAFEAQQFPDPMGLRLVLERWTLGLYPNGIKWLMAVFDAPEAICVSHTAICAAAGALAPLTRLQAAGYYLGVLAYYWVLATPTVGFLFGCYLFLSVNLFHVHYDEAFSSLQVPHFKGFCRFHITRSGDLEMYSLGLEKVPFHWREDPRWRMPQGGGNPDAPSHKARYPSRWLPVEKQRLGGQLRAAPTPEERLQVVDYLLVPRRAPPRTAT